MSFSCIAVVASLCVLRQLDMPADFSVRLYEGPVYGSAEISTGDWKAGQTLYSDCPGCGPDKKWFSKACAGDNCVSYNRQCDDPEHPTFCEYYFDKHQPVDLMAKSEQDFKDAVSSIGLVVDDHRTSDLPFSLFSEESKAPHNPNAPLHNYMLPKNQKNEGGQPNGSH